MRSFESITLGETAKIRHTITDVDVRRFSELSGDDNRLHVDKDFASKTQFARPVAHGMLGVSFISTVIGTKLPGDGALWHKQTLEFLRPVFIGDTITVTAVVTEKHVRTRSIVLDVHIRNHKRQVVTRGQAWVKLLEERHEERPLIDAHASDCGPVLILGGSGGIGSAVARNLASSGYPVAIHYHRHAERALHLAEEIRAIGGTAITVSADCTDASQLMDAVNVVQQRLGGLLGLVFAVTSPLEFPDIAELSWSEMEQSLRIDVLGAWNAIQSALPLMKSQGKGSIVVLSSQAVDTPNADWLPYITAKAALEGMARTMAVALAPSGIRVNIVAPGMTNTALIAGLPSLARMRVQSNAPLKRLADPHDVAQAVAFLVSESSSYITGETLRVNGGQVMR